MSKLYCFLPLPAVALAALMFVGCSKEQAPAPPAVVEEEVVEEVEVPAVQGESPAAETPSADAPATETPATETPAAEAPAAEPPAADAPAADAAANESSDATDALAALSEADRTAALAQKICPVSGEPLGSMGTPIKVTAAGRDVFLCCDGCKEKFEANPDEFLAKLDAAK